jgi:hypothetical protein
MNRAIANITDHLSSACFALCAGELGALTAFGVAWFSRR